jgi:hypothetical protein
MHVLVLSSRCSDNPYGDTDEVSVFPKPYLARIEPLTQGEAQKDDAWTRLDQAPRAWPDEQFAGRYNGGLIAAEGRGGWLEMFTSPSLGGLRLTGSGGTLTPSQSSRPC